MLNYNELKPGKIIVFEEQPYVVVEFNFLRMQQRKPVTQVKMKNIISGKVLEKTFQPSDKFEEAEIETKQIKYLYSHRGEHWFCETDNPSARFKLEPALVEHYVDLMKANTVVSAKIFNEKTIAIELPIKVELKVVEAPPSTKGNTAQGGSKQVKVETGAAINTPLFINEGDVIVVNTQSREYVERANK
ncbi:MAG: elongation factor P [Candidatus Pacebacteria bacterium]|nr:elongation factor P [Candidatus Paceibacterota bacterium]NUQ57654.1 elongation factor P [Candidatus Paceibacter sp.]